MALLTGTNLIYKNSVVARTIGDISLTYSAFPTIDGVLIKYGDTVLVMEQTDPVENGVYVATIGSFNRNTDMNSSLSLVRGAIVNVTGGTVHANTEWFIAPIAAADFVTASKVVISSPFVGGGSGITGTGTTGFLPKWSSSSSITDSLLSDDGTNLITNASIIVYGTALYADTIQNATATYLNIVSSSGINFWANGSTMMYLDALGNFSIGLPSVSTTRLHLRGATADSSEYTFIAEDSATNQRFKIRNDGMVSSRLGYWINDLKVFDTNNTTNSLYLSPGVNQPNLSSGTYNYSMGGYNLLTNTGNNNVAIGWAAVYSNTTGSHNVGIGGDGSLRLNDTGNANTAVGSGAGYGNTSGSNNSYLGRNAGYGLSTGDNNVFIGATAGYYRGYLGTSGQYSSTIAIGVDTRPDANNQLVIGSVSAPITNAYLGKGVTGNPAAMAEMTIQNTGTDTSYTDGSAATSILTIAGARGTGTGLGGDIVFKVAPAGTTGSTQNPLVEAMRIAQNGRVGIGTTPATSALLDLSSTTGALILTRLTTTQRNALTAINGMVIYNITDDKFQGYEAGAWVNLV